VFLPPSDVMAEIIQAYESNEVVIEELDLISVF
jgi:hypothetical protein